MDNGRVRQWYERAGVAHFYEEALGDSSAVTFHSAKDLMERDLPPVRWIVPEILPEGVTLLAGKPKLGKSWLSLGLCVAVAAGGAALGKVRVERGESLYLALEENERRLKSRLEKVLAPDQGRAPEGFYYTTSFPRLNEGGLEAIAKWLDEHPDARLIVIDTLAKIRPRVRGHNTYQEDYEALEGLLPLAARHNVAMLVVHHLRKMAAADPLDEINSSIGLTGGVDGALILKRDRSRADASLFVTGRDIEEEQDLALRWDATCGSWMLLGDAEEYRDSQERVQIIDFIRAAGRPVGIKEVADALEKNYKTVAALMAKMLDQGSLLSPSYGKYSLPKSQPEVEVPTVPTVPTGYGGRSSYGSSYGGVGSVGSVGTSTSGLGFYDDPLNPALCEHDLPRSECPECSGDVSS